MDIQNPGARQGGLGLAIPQDQPIPTADAQAVAQDNRGETLDTWLGPLDIQRVDTRHHVCRAMMQMDLETLADASVMQRRNRERNIKALCAMIKISAGDPAATGNLFHRYANKI
jgi:hypothetical protein